MQVLICLIFVIVSITALLPKNIVYNFYISEIKINPKYIFIVFGIILIIISGFRGDNVDRDYLNYINRFNLFNKSWSFKIEPTFVLISKIVKSIFNSNVSFLFFIYAIIGISSKLYAIERLSQFWTLSLLVYLSYLFTIQDLTQIRAGAASGFIMLSIKPLYERKTLKFFLFAVIAILFHYSAVIALMFWFLNPKEINKYLYFALIPVSYVIHYFTIIDSDFLKEIMFVSPLMNKFLAYQFENYSPINIYNTWQLMRILLGILFLWKIELITLSNKYGIILTKLYIISTCAYVVFAFNPVFASRLSDLLTISDIVLLPCILYIIKPNIFARLIVIFISFSYLFLNLFYNKIIL